MASNYDKCKHEVRRNRTYYANMRHARTLRVDLGWYIREEVRETRWTPEEETTPPKSRVNRYIGKMQKYRDRGYDDIIHFMRRRLRDAELKEMISESNERSVTCDTCNHIYFEDEALDNHRCPSCGFSYGSSLAAEFYDVEKGIRYSVHNHLTDEALFFELDRCIDSQIDVPEQWLLYTNPPRLRSKFAVDTRFPIPNYIRTKFPTGEPYV